MTNERMIAGLRFRSEVDSDGKTRLRVGEYVETEGRIVVTDGAESQPFAMAIVESGCGRVEGHGRGVTADEAVTEAISNLIRAASVYMGSRFTSWLEREGEAARG